MYEGFESQNFDFWDTQFQTNGTLAISNVNPAAGAYHMRATVNAVAAQKRVCLLKSFPSAQLKHVQAIIEYANGDGASTNRLTLLALYPSTASDPYLAIITMQGGKLYVQYRHSGGYPRLDTGAIMPPKTKARLELSVKIGAGTGEVHAWLNGQEIANITGVDNSVDGQISTMRTGAVFADVDYPAEIVDVDEVRIEDAYIGIPPLDPTMRTLVPLVIICTFVVIGALSLRGKKT